MSSVVCDINTRRDQVQDIKEEDVIWCEQEGTRASKLMVSHLKSSLLLLINFDM